MVHEVEPGWRSRFWSATCRADLATCLEDQVTCLEDLVTCRDKILLLPTLPQPWEGRLRYWCEDDVGNCTNGQLTMLIVQMDNWQQLTMLGPKTFQVANSLNTMGRDSTSQLSSRPPSPGTTCYVEHECKMPWFTIQPFELFGCDHASLWPCLRFIGGPFGEVLKVFGGTWSIVIDGQMVNGYDLGLGSWS